MMEALFLKLLNMSITASWLVLAIAVLRLLLKKAPKAVTVYLWVLVGIRLVCPFSLESALCLLPSAETLPETVLTGPRFDVNTGIAAVDSRVNSYLGDHYFEAVTAPAENGMTVMGVLSVIWLVGAAVMLIYTVVSFIRIHRQVREGTRLEENIFLCDRIATPFILGIFRPKIYLPSSLGRTDAVYVIAHEKAHLRRRDHLIKPLGFLLLTVYWFNPVIWVAYILLCRDIELACDEKVIRELGEQSKKPYSEALVNCSLPRRTVAACPLAFGEVGVKSRIRSVLHYKKPAFWVVLAAVVVSIVVAVCFLTNPKSHAAGIPHQKSGSELTGLASEIASIEPSAPDPYLTVSYHNGTGGNLTYGEEFYIYRKTGDRWEDCRLANAYAWDAVGYAMKPGAASTHAYRLNGQAMSQPGQYRFETKFTTEGSPDTAYTVFVEFELTRGVDGITVHTFEPAEPVYSEGASVTDAAGYRLVNGMELQKIDCSGAVTSICHLENIALGRDTFDSRFSEHWRNGCSLQSLKSSNQQAWQQTVTRDGRQELYLLLRQQDGTFYLGYGDYDAQSAGKRNPDGSQIRQLYPLRKTELVPTNGRLIFYEGATDESAAPRIAGSADLSEADFQKLQTALERLTWVNDAVVDRMAFSFNGSVYCDGWIPFGYAQRVVYRNGYFATMSDEILDILKRYDSNTAAPDTGSGKNP